MTAQRFSCPFQNARVVLPFGADPESFDWSFVDKRDILVYSFGEREPLEKLIALSVLLVQSGADFVLWSHGLDEFGRPSRIFRRAQA
jgi:hypothetical protein